MPLTIGVPRETFPGEKRVATVPEVVEKLIKLGFAVRVETGAGADANFSDDTYRPPVRRSRAVPPSSSAAPTSSSRCAPRRRQKSR